MTSQSLTSFMTAYLHRFREDDSGVTLVELAIIIPVFLLLLFGLIDFGRMSGDYVMANKAMHTAVRMAAVRPPVAAQFCGGVAVPATNLRGPVQQGTIPPRFGTSCSAGANVCATPAAAICTGDATDPTANEIWTKIQPMMPAGSSPSNLLIRYEFDSNLGFLGGPYIPVVTVELQNLNFQFVTPLGGLAALAGATGSTMPNSVTVPPMSTSMPAEDLASGNNG
ncbi:pilus assembly protein [Defluviimonas aestuarii]|uniref:TadE/TadG family type IV pilus assembly protein n=1 Tax=Albidovulum aestuarii TaxID=1130726 RepID=UPI002499E89D|nr:TadE/TadG family type IV pilus assembly protein [Defluviimonas aestuarii]MDI3334886.1 pilus assembly protein [Defluviimonas aestuarii]